MDPAAGEASFYGMLQAKPRLRTPAHQIPACFALHPTKCSPQHIVCWRMRVASWNKIARRIRVPLGFLFAAVYLWLAHPTPRSIVLGGWVATVGLVIRALAS